MSSEQERANQLYQWYLRRLQIKEPYSWVPLIPMYFLVGVFFVQFNFKLTQFPIFLNWILLGSCFAVWFWADREQWKDYESKTQKPSWVKWE